VFYAPAKGFYGECLIHDSTWGRRHINKAERTL